MLFVFFSGCSLAFPLKIEASPQAQTPPYNAPAFNQNAPAFNQNAPAFNQNAPAFNQEELVYAADADGGSGVDQEKHQREVMFGGCSYEDSAFRRFDARDLDAPTVSRWNDEIVDIFCSLSVLLGFWGIFVYRRRQPR